TVMCWFSLFNPPSISILFYPLAALITNGPSTSAISGGGSVNNSLNATSNGQYSSPTTRTSAALPVITSSNAKPPFHGDVKTASTSQSALVRGDFFGTDEFRFRMQLPAAFPRRAGLYFVFVYALIHLKWNGCVPLGGCVCILIT